MNLLEAIALHLPRGFTIEGLLGRGATSSVYLASCAGTGDRLVVKVMRPGTVTPESADRFFREMQILKRLEHPRIIPILEPGEANGVLFFTMPYIPGETLRTRLEAQQRLSVRETLLIARDVSDALGHAHARGIVHRDVKPENILLADDWRSDFYSLGCVMHEMLAGRPLFSGASPRATIMRRMTHQPPEIRSLRPDVPEEVARIIRCNLDPHPTGRFATAGFLRMALDAAIQGLREAC